MPKPTRFPTEVFRTTIGVPVELYREAKFYCHDNRLNFEELVAAALFRYLNNTPGPYAALDPSILPPGAMTDAGYTTTPPRVPEGTDVKRRIVWPKKKGLTGLVRRPIARR